ALARGPRRPRPLRHPSLLERLDGRRHRAPAGVHRRRPRPGGARRLHGAPRRPRRRPRRLPRADRHPPGLLAARLMAADYSIQELFAVVLARDLRPSDRSVQIGANMPMARAAAVMASLGGLPDLRILVGLGVNNLADGRPLPVYPFLFDPRSQVGEAVMVQETVFDDAKMPDVFFVGGLQVDRRGNINLFGIRDGEGGWKLRGPGGVALCTMSTNCAGYYIVMQRHEPRTFVESVDLITALGDRAERERLRLPGGGPRFVLSPLGVFDFDAE